MNGLNVKHEVKDHDSQDESELWLAIQNGDHTSFRVFYMAYTDILYNYGMKICNNDDIVRDCIQDIFEYLWKNKEKVEIQSSIKLYLLTSVKRAIIKKLKDDDKSSDLSNNKAFELSVESRIINEEAENHKKHLLSKALQQLTKKQREIIFLRYQENLSYEEISLIMSLNRNSMYKLLHAAIKRIKQSVVLILIGILTNLSL